MKKSHRGNQLDRLTFLFHYRNDVFNRDINPITGVGTLYAHTHTSSSNRPPGTELNSFSRGIRGRNVGKNKERKVVLRVQDRALKVQHGLNGRHRDGRVSLSLSLSAE